MTAIRSASGRVYNSATSTVGPSVHQFFERQVERTPDRVALIYDGRHISYHELNGRCNQVARYLRRQEVGPGRVVAVCLERSLDAVLIIMGILKTGGAYLPLDPEFPEALLTVMVKESGVRLVITDFQRGGAIEAIESEVVRLENIWDAVRRESLANVASSTTPESPAYVIYTSGSTGKPKGLILPHSCIINGLSDVPFEVRSGEEVCCLNSSLSFGFTAARLFLPLLTGVPLVVLSSQQAADHTNLLNALEEYCITSAAFITPLLRQLLDSKSAATGRLSTLRSVVVGGSPVTGNLIAAFRAAVPYGSLLVGYAMSEAGGAVLVLDAALPDSDPRLGGQSFPNVQVHLLDDSLKTVSEPESVAELYVGAPHLAQGYVASPESTAASFLPDPFSGAAGGRLFRTGDLARRLADGRIQVLGRLDQQVKIRGFRVELGQVEAALEEHQAVRCAAVQAHPIGDDKRLVAYVVMKGNVEGRPRVLRKFLAERLPQYMLPSVFMFLDDLPRTNTGKLDRLALPTPGLTRPDIGLTYVPPFSPTELALEEIWSEFLGVEPIGIEDVFVELGGDSLIAGRIASGIFSVFGLDIPVNRLMDMPTIAQLAAYIDGTSRQVARNTSAPNDSEIRRADRTSDLPLSLQQEALLLQELYWATQSTPCPQVRGVMGLSLKGELNGDALVAVCSAIAARHEILRTTFSLAMAADKITEGAWMEIAREFPFGQSSFRQTIHAVPKLHLTEIDLQGVSAASAALLVRAITGAASAIDFDYSSLPLIRQLLVKLAPQEHVFIVVMPHLITDESSFRVFLQDLVRSYAACSEGFPLPLVPLLQYADYACWQRGRLREGVESHVTYWKSRLGRAKLLTVQDLSFYRPTAPAPALEVGIESVILDPTYCKRIRSFSAKRSITPHVLFLASLMALLHIQTKQERIGLVVFCSNRTADTEALIGWFANAFPLGVEVSGETDLAELLDRVREEITTLRLHQEMPLNAVLKAASPHHGEKDADVRPKSVKPPRPLPNIAFDFVSRTTERVAGALKIGLSDLPGTQTDFALKILVMDDVGEMTITALYHRSHFQATDIHDLICDLRDAVEALTSAKSGSLPVRQMPAFRLDSQAASALGSPTHTRMS